MKFMVKLELTQCQTWWAPTISSISIIHGAKAYFFNVEVCPNAAEEERLLQIYHQDRPKAGAITWGQSSNTRSSYWNISPVIPPIFPLFSHLSDLSFHYLDSPYELHRCRACSIGARSCRSISSNMGMQHRRSKISERLWSAWALNRTMVEPWCLRDPFGTDSDTRAYLKISWVLGTKKCVKTVRNPHRHLTLNVTEVGPLWLASFHGSGAGWLGWQQRHQTCDEGEEKWERISGTRKWKWLIL